MKAKIFFKTNTIDKYADCTDILNWFRKKVHEQGGGNYQTLINEALREYKRLKENNLEETLRKVIREELSVNSK
jgi:hypothetical protein